MFAAIKPGFVPILAARLALVLLLTAVFPSELANAQDLDAGVVNLLVTTRQGVGRVGSGFIVRLDSDRAYVVTAAHVVEGSREIGVIFSSPSRWGGGN